MLLSDPIAKSRSRSVKIRFEFEEYHNLITDASVRSNHKQTLTSIRRLSITFDESVKCYLQMTRQSEFLQRRGRALGKGTWDV
ncbi:uncharacterized protein BT62DRAFT_937508 [Guyanagaster necrorhizus]|uniref:Uncharacterized protein n=1 Tax=Guyanagaster necrorhizus TaxID=856835 RepID=A0A9P8AM53_9AGAR|nr:uncharacterized protein BT62DRAFT_937508 [Guyanagaster necrorhizus MCA 3950]KAG7440913.1 hypothetical protein BT62DRAFT_937508 [Guyanagaster necrorhizus MCA 3950]